MSLAKKYHPKKRAAFNLVFWGILRGKRGVGRHTHTHTLKNSFGAWCLKSLVLIKQKYWMLKTNMWSIWLSYLQRVVSRGSLGTLDSRIVWTNHWHEVAGQSYVACLSVSPSDHAFPLTASLAHAPPPGSFSGRCIGSVCSYGFQYSRCHLP